MKTIRTLLILLGLFLCVACNKDDEAGEITSMRPEYNLPQGKSEADAKILDIYNKYGSYIVYEYTDLDFYYEIENNYIYTLPNPKDVNSMMELLDETWLQFYSDKFLKKYLPYTIFLTDSLRYDEWEEPIVTGTTSMAIAQCNANIKTMTSDAKNEFKTFIQMIAWYHWIGNSNFKGPESFYKVSTYDKAADTENPDSPNYARARGFIAGEMGEWEWSDNVDWETKKLNPQTDFESFIINMVCLTDEQWENDLKWELVKQKYDILKKYFMDEYQIDITKIGNTVL